MSFSTSLSKALNTCSVIMMVSGNAVLRTQSPLLYTDDSTAATIGALGSAVVFPGLIFIFAPIIVLIYPELEDDTKNITNTFLITVMPIPVSAAAGAIGAAILKIGDISAGNAARAGAVGGSVFLAAELVGIILLLWAVVVSDAWDSRYEMAEDKNSTLI
ncbi:hypothetical protein BDQ17DRAFT_1322631 [Cyathus striatus]|nr:hypothetical protein BDQ17DRAFT_1322631 [Cyathus striatus]